MNSPNGYDCILISAFHNNQEIKIKGIRSQLYDIAKIKDVGGFTVPLECIILNTKQEVLLCMSEIDFRYINPESIQ